jgi:hypothetical protein
LNRQLHVYIHMYMRPHTHKSMPPRASAHTHARTHAHAHTLTHTQAMFIVQDYQTSQHVVPPGGIFLGKWCSSFVGRSDGKMNVQSACTLNTQYIQTTAA